MKVDDLAAAEIAVAKALRKEAKRNTRKDPSFRIFTGWKFGMSYGPVALPSREVVDAYKGPVSRRMSVPELGVASYEQIAAASARMDALHVVDHQWILSASLHPRGRSSAEEDWRFLGQMLAAFRAPEDSLRTPFETTDPNDVHYWIWIDSVDLQ
jgi:hypothetical protein